MAVKIFPTARSRLLEIWEYTEKTWGEEQADQYVRELVAAIQAEAESPKRWKSVRDRHLKGVYGFRHRHHYVFFRELSGRSIGVLTILHENMDIPSRLKEDVREAK